MIGKFDFNFAMCGRFELTTEFEKLPSILKKDLPRNFQSKYAKQALIKPTDPVIVLKNEGKASTTIMLWGFISEWAKDPFNPSRARPFNARSETISETKLFKGSWQHKRCVLPASGFFEKGHRISRKNNHPFWLAGIWSRWIGPEGNEIETCCVLTTKPNVLIKPIHNRMPVIIPNGLEEEWISPVKYGLDLEAFKSILKGWDPKDWSIEERGDVTFSQLKIL